MIMTLSISPYRFTYTSDSAKHAISTCYVFVPRGQLICEPIFLTFLVDYTRQAELTKSWIVVTSLYETSTIGYINVLQWLVKRKG